MLFINTRPNVRYAFDVPDGVCVLDLPLLELSERSVLTDCECRLFGDFVEGRFAVVIVVSVMAVQCALSRLAAQGIHSVKDLPSLPTFIAVGQATKQALSAFGIDAMVPEVQSNEGMLQLPVLQNLQKHDRVLVWRGVGGRRLVDETLTARDIDIKGIAFYQRQPNQHLASLVRQHKPCLMSDQTKVVLISSQMSLTVWQSLDCNTDGIVYLALGERLYGLTLKTYPDNKALMITSLEADELSLVLKNMLQYHPD